VRGLLRSIQFWGILSVPLLITTGNAMPDVMASVVACVFFVNLSYDNRLCRLLKEDWVVISFVFWLYMIGHSLLLEGVYSNLKVSLPWIRFVFFAASIKYIFGELYPYKLKYVLTSLALAVIILATCGVVQYIRLYSELGTFPVRLSGPFHEHRLGAVLTFISFPVLGYVLHLRNVGSKFYNCFTIFAVFTSLIVVIVMTGDRMPMLLTVIGVGILSFNYMSLDKTCNRGGGRTLVASIVATIAILLVTGILAPQIDRTIREMSKAGNSHHLMVLKDSLIISRQSPFKGVGLRNMRSLCLASTETNPKKHINPEYCAIHSHNYYLEVYTTLGLFGLIIFLSLIYVLVRKMVPYFVSHRDDAIFLGLAVELFLRLFPFSITTSFFGNWGSVPFWLVLGLCLARTQIK
jgi:O-antigen ligase